MSNKSDSNLDENIQTIKNEAIGIADKLSAELKTENGKKNINVIVVLLLTMSIMALVYVLFSGKIVNHSLEETKAHASEQVKIAKEIIINKVNANKE